LKTVITGSVGAVVNWLDPGATHAVSRMTPNKIKIRIRRMIHLFSFAIDLRYWRWRKCLLAAKPVLKAPELAKVTNGHGTTVACLPTALILSSISSLCNDPEQNNYDKMGEITGVDTRLYLISVLLSSQ